MYFMYRSSNCHQHSLGLLQAFGQWNAARRKGARKREREALTPTPPPRCCCLFFVLFFFLNFCKFQPHILIKYIRMKKQSVQATQAQCDSACCIMLRNRQMAVNIKDFY